MKIDTARKMLADSRKKKCGHGSSYTCVHCEARVRAEVWLEGLDAERMFPALILAVDALEAEKKARLATGWQSTCDQQVHGDSHIQCGKCFICLERKALAAWEKL